jgi:long-chain acyl-CoA synthetase
MSVEGAPTTLVADSRIRAHFAAVMDGVNQGLASFETVKYFALLSRDFTEEQDELTPSLKKKRRIISRHFQDVVDEMYIAHKKPHAD